MLYIFAEMKATQVYTRFKLNSGNRLYISCPGMHGLEFSDFVSVSVLKALLKRDSLPVVLYM